MTMHLPSTALPGAPGLFQDPAAQAVSAAVFARRGGQVGGLAGTVTSVSVTGANGIGVSGSPIISAGTIALSLGAITPTSVAATGTVTGSNLSGTNTGDQTITLTGDVTGTGTGSFATTLATVNASVGSFGSSTAIPSFTVNAKGLITSASTNAVIAPAGTLTGTTLAAGVVTSSLTTVGTIGTGVWQGTAVAAGFGGTGQSSYTVGDILYASGASALSKLADVATGNALISGGVATAPAWGKIGLTTHVSGTLPEANGGTGFTAFGSGVAAWLQTPSSANLRTALTDETGTGALVFANTPTLVTPVIGSATGTSVNLSSTATASAFIPSGSSVPSNGLYLPAADNVSISTASTERIRIDSSGNVLPFTVGVFGSVGNPWGSMYSTGTIRGNAMQTASSGSGSGVWKLGVAVAGVGLTLNTTSYVEIDIGGTTHKLAKVN